MLGCDTKSFRDVYEEIEHAYQIADGEWEVPTTIEVYPRSIKNHHSLKGEYYIPSLVGKIYNEVILAFTEDALILAGMGLRGTVEAVCNDLQVSGKNLELRISKLATAGYISRKDAERLHGIRFMGNDAAHEIKKPDISQLTVALKIVEHLLSSVYILEKEAQGKIDTIITDFNNFENLLLKKLNTFELEKELPIAAILGRDIRRVKDSLASLEADLIKKIDNGEITEIKKGKIEKYQGSTHELQHYFLPAI